MSIADEAIPVMPRGVRIHHDKVRDMQVLLAPERAITLDPIGQAILGEIDGTRTFGTITAGLAEAYSAPIDQIKEDSAGFITALLHRRILELK